MEKIQRMETAQLLSAAIKEAHRWEAELLGDEATKGPAEKAFEALSNGRIELGHPEAYVQRLHPEDFEVRGLELSPEINDSMRGKEGYAFYVMPVPVLLFPGRGAQYRLLESQFEFGVELGQRRPAIHAIFPEPLWKPVLDWGGTFHLALDSNLHWGAEVEGARAQLSRLSGHLAGRVENANQLRSFIKIAPFEYTLGRMEIEAQFSSDTAMWRLDSERIIRSQKHVHLVALLRVPKEVTQMQIQAATQAEPSFVWLAAQIKHVFDRLPQAIQQIVKEHRGLPLQDFQTWNLDLPA